MNEPQFGTIVIPVRLRRQLELGGETVSRNARRRVQGKNRRPTVRAHSPGSYGVASSHCHGAVDPLAGTPARQRPTPLNASYYVQRSSAALIISEATQVSLQGQGYAWTPGIHSREQVEGWRLVTDVVRAAGGRIFLQLWHVGRISHPALQPDGMPPVAPSAIRPAGQAFIENDRGEGELVPFVTPRALDIVEMQCPIAAHLGDKSSQHRGTDGLAFQIGPPAREHCLDQLLFRRRQITKERRLSTAHIAQFPRLTSGPEWIETRIWPHVRTSRYRGN